MDSKPSQPSQEDLLRVAATAGDTTMASYALRVRASRRCAGLTVDQVARHLDTYANRVRRWEGMRGQSSARKPPSEHRRLAHLLNVEPDWLIGGYLDMAPVWLSMQILHLRQFWALCKSLCGDYTDGFQSPLQRKPEEWIADPPESFKTCWSVFNEGPLGQHWRDFRRLASTFEE